MCVKKSAACGDLDWPCCAPDGPEGGECLKGKNLTCRYGTCVKHDGGDKTGGKGKGKKDGKGKGKKGGHKKW